MTDTGVTEDRRREFESNFVYYCLGMFSPEYMREFGEKFRNEISEKCGRKN